MSEIKGYRNLSPGEVEDINQIKELGQLCSEFIVYLRTEANADPRWISIAETHLQQGFMAAVRSIAKPEGF